MPGKFCKGFVSTELNRKQKKLFKRGVNYLGRIVSADGYRVDPSNTQAVLSLKHTKPRTVRDVRKPLGLLGYYQKYLQDLSRIAQPLFEHLETIAVKSSSPVNPRGQHVQRGNRVQVPSSHRVIWTQEHEEVLERLVDCLVNPPIMGYPDYSLPFVLHTNASKERLEAVL